MLQGGDGRKAAIGTCGFTAKPDGTGTVETGYSILPEHQRRGYAPEAVTALIEFLKATFDAQEIDRIVKPDGSIMNAAVAIGNSRLMMGDPGDRPSEPAMLYVYVQDCDAIYAKATAAGATSIMAPADMFYGDRSGAVQDASGSTWWIATHKEDVPHEEIVRRAAAARRQDTSLHAIAGTGRRPGCRTDLGGAGVAAGHNSPNSRPCTPGIFLEGAILDGTGCGPGSSGPPLKAHGCGPAGAAFVTDEHSSQQFMVRTMGRRPPARY